MRNIVLKKNNAEDHRIMRNMVLKRDNSLTSEAVGTGSGP